MVMAVLLTNNARSTLLNGINALQTEIRLRAGGGNTFPTITTPGQWFPITIEDSLGNIEIMRVIARSGDVFTVKRAQEGTTAKSFSANDVVELRLTVGAMQELVNDTHANFGRIYMTPADGVDSKIGVPAGYYFNVRSPSDDSYVDEYQNVNGVAVATGKSYPSGALTQAMSEQIDKIGSLDYLSEQLDQIAVDKGWDASFVVDASGKTQQEVNDALYAANNAIIDPLTKEGVLGDGQFRIITDLWTVGTSSYRFADRAAAEAYLGFNISTELVDVGTNSTVDTAYLQKYIKEASARFMSTGIAETIKLKNNATYIIVGLQLYPGVNLISDGQTEFKKRPALTITNEGVLKWWRIATCRTSAFASEAATKHRNIIKGIKFNGNMLEMNWTYNTYNQEQGSSLLIQCANGANANIRARFDLQDLVFINSLSDGLHIVQNSDVIFNNLQAYNCFRGGLVITGGNSIVYGDGMVSNNARTDIEIDTAGFGAVGQRAYAYINIKNYFQDVGGKIGDFVGGCDLGGYDNSEFYFENFHVMTAPTNIITGGSAATKAKKFEMKNSTLTLGVGSGSANRIINPCVMLFDNVKLRLLNGGLMSILTNFNGYISNDDYTFKDCSAEQVEGSASNQVFRIESQLANHAARLILNGGDYSKATTAYLIRHQAGGKTVVDNVKHASTSGVVYRRVLSGYPSNVEFGRINKNSTAVNLYVPESPLDTTNVTEFDASCVVDINQNLNTSNQVGLLKNKRTVFSDTQPTATTRSFIGDKFTLNTPEVGKPYEWIATTNSTTASSYRASKWLVGSFATASLPVLTAFDVGCQNVDSTLNKLVTWNGTSWV